MKCASYRDGHSPLGEGVLIKSACPLTMQVAEVPWTPQSVLTTSKVISLSLCVHVCLYIFIMVKYT